MADNLERIEASRYAIPSDDRAVTRPAPQTPLKNGVAYKEGVGHRNLVTHETDSVISMGAPDITLADREAVNHVLTTSVLSIGPQLEAFERETADYIGTARAVGVNSGTSGLHLCVIAADVNESDLVITTPFSFVASANCILYERAIPVFVDVDPTTGNIDPALVAEAVDDLSRGGAAAKQWLPPRFRGSRRVMRRKVKAILPVHAFGQPADMDPINAVAQERGLAVIEDACEAIGAEYKGRKAGTLGNAAVFAFYPNKQMTTGEGGMVVTDDEGWANVYKSLRNQGRDVFDAWLKHTRLGYNYRMDEMSAALGLVQMKRIDTILAKRSQVARWYDERLGDLELIDRPRIVPTTSRMSWFVYVVRVRKPARRNKVMRALSALGIPSRPYFSPIHLQPFYQERFGYQPGDFPITEHLADVSLALPFSGVMTEDEVDRVCSTLRDVLYP